jgi:enoyl-CoA hydratase/carnithine racemase
MTSIGDVVGASSEPFVVKDYGSTRVIAINRPEARNALTRQMRRDFPAYIRSAVHDTSVTAVILTGMGSAFSAGVDLKERHQGPPQPPVVPNPAEVLCSSPKPVIAAVNGACVTGALEMALSCSFIIASDQARFADTHSRLGLVPRWGQSARLPDAVGIRRARQLLLTGAFIDASTALDWGLVNEVVPPARLLDRCLQIGEDIARAHPVSLAEQLEISRMVEAGALQAGMEAERRACARLDSVGGGLP